MGLSRFRPLSFLCCAGIVMLGATGLRAQGTPGLPSLVVPTPAAKLPGADTTQIRTLAHASKRPPQAQVLGQPFNLGVVKPQQVVAPTPKVPRNDFTGDGKSDLVWRHASSGGVYVMPMVGLVPQPGAVAWTEPDPEWRIVGSGDLDGDRKADLIWWQRTTGMVYGMLMDGGVVKGGGVVHVEPDTSWQIQAVADFNGDGNSDLLWRNTTSGMVYVMPMIGLQQQAGAVVWTEPDPTWTIQGTGDFDGDACADLLWRNTGTGMLYLMKMNGPQIRAGAVLYTEPDTAWVPVALLDFNGDGTTDLLWRHTSSGQVYAMPILAAMVQPGEIIWTEPDANWLTMATGDYDGDGRDDLVWWNRTSGVVYQMQLNGPAIKDAAVVWTEPDTTWLLQAGGTLAQPNLAPTNVQIQGPASVVQNHTATYVLSASDPEGSSITFSKKFETDPYTIVGNVLTFTPLAVGDAVIAVIAKDGASQTTEQTRKVEVSANRAPVMTLPGTITMDAATEKTQNLGPDRDADDDPVTYTSADMPVFATILGNQLNIKPAKADGGQSYHFTVTGADGFGGTTSTAVTLVVNPAAIVFSVTNVTQPTVAVAGRTYPNDGKPRAISTDAFNNRFTASCDYPVTPTDELTWSFIYKGTTIQEKTTMGANGATLGVFVEFNPITIPLIDLGTSPAFSVQVADTKGNLARSNVFVLTPTAPNFPWVTSVRLNDVRGLRYFNGSPWALQPIWNAPASAAELVWPKQNIDVVLTATDNGTGGTGLTPFTFSNPRALTGVAVALMGEISVKKLTDTTANLIYSPSKADIGSIPYFLVDVTNAAGLKTTYRVSGLAAATGFVTAQYTGATMDQTQGTVADAGKLLRAPRANVAPNIYPVPSAGPANVAAEEGAPPYKVVVGVHMTVSDNDFFPGANLDFTDVLGVLPPYFAGPGTKSYASGYLNNPVLTDVNNEGVDTYEVSFTRTPYTLTWNPTHANVRKELKFTVKAGDLYDAVSPTGLSWTTQVSAMTTGFKLDTVVNGTIPTQTPFNIPGVDARVIKVWPIRTKGTQGTLASPAAPYGTNLVYGLTGPSEFGVTAAATNGIFTTPSTNPSTAGVTRAYFRTYGLMQDNDGTNPGPTANVVPYGYYMTKVDDTRAGIRYADINNRFFFSNVTDGLDLSKTYIGRDTVGATPAAAAAGSNLRIATLNGLFTWDVKHSALQFTNVNLNAGNVFLNVNDGAVAGGSNVLKTTNLRLPFPGVHDLIQNIVDPAPTTFPLLDGARGTSNGALVVDFAGRQPNVANERVIITQLAPKILTVGAHTVQAMALTRFINPSRAPLPVLAPGTTDYLNTDATASTAPEATWFLNLKRSSYFAAIPGTAGASTVPASYAPAATYNENFSIYQAQSPAAGFQKNAPILFHFQNLVNGGTDTASAPITTGTDINLGLVTFGNPFNTGTTVAEYFAQASVTVSDGAAAATFSANAADNGTYARVGSVTATQATADTADAPGITPVTGVTFQYTVAPVAPDTTVTVKTVDVTNRLTATTVTHALAIAYGQGTAANGTAAFTLKWTAPDNYSGADVEVWKYTGVATVPTLVTTFTTGGSSILIPTRMLPAGSSYFFRIRGYYMPGVNFNTTPLKRVFPMHYADFVTQAVQMI